MTFFETMLPGRLSRSQARQLAGAMIIFIFVFLLLMVTIPARTIPHFYGKAGYALVGFHHTLQFCLIIIQPSYSPWCWITDRSVESSRMKIGAVYAFYWLAASISVVVYGTIAVKWFREASAEHDRQLIRSAIAIGWWVSQCGAFSGKPLMVLISVHSSRYPIGAVVYPAHFKRKHQTDVGFPRM